MLTYTSHPHNCGIQIAHPFASAQRTYNFHNGRLSIQQPLFNLNGRTLIPTVAWNWKRADMLWMLCELIADSDTVYVIGESVWTELKRSSPTQDNDIAAHI